MSPPPRPQAPIHSRFRRGRRRRRRSRRVHARRHRGRRFRLPGVQHSVHRPCCEASVILEHGAFADASSWDGVITDLRHDGYPVIAAANPLRGPAYDAAALRSVIEHVKGPVTLVDHSYGGSVISQAAAGESNVKALVYVAAFLPAPGESALQLTNQFPGLHPARVSSGSRRIWWPGGCGSQGSISGPTRGSRRRRGRPIPARCASPWPTAARWSSTSCCWRPSARPGPGTSAWRAWDFSQVTGS